MQSSQPICFEARGRRAAPGTRRVASVACAAVLAALAACGKPGDTGGGTDRARSMASPASTPSTGLPEPTPGAASGAASTSGR